MANVAASYSPKHFLLKILSNLLDLCLADSRILYFWNVLEFIIELLARQNFFGGLISNKEEVGLFQI